jgi:hypothetical protein
MKRKLVWAMIAALLAFGAAGCGERDQTTQYRDGKYRGKSDTRPWDNAPAATSTGSWTKGDNATWENEMRTRTIASQNEHRRIGH